MKYYENFSLENLPNEEWRDVQGFPNYAVSNFARVKRLKYIRYYLDGRVRHNEERIVKQTSKDGYKMVRLFNEKTGRKGILVKTHRLVAIAFIPNPDNKPYIDHINTIRDDNRIENLRWVTAKENSNNTITRKRNSQSRRKFIEDNPEYRLIMSQISKSKFADKEFKEKFKKRMNDTEVRDKIFKSNRQKKRVFHYDADGKLIAIYQSTKKASLSIGVTQAMISRYCLGKAKPKNKHIFSYNAKD